MNVKRNLFTFQEELLRLISPDEEAQEKGSVILTHARPVAVLANTSQSEVGDLANGEELDWSRLVSAAARVIQGTSSNHAIKMEQEEEQVPTHDETEDQDSLASWIDDVTEKLRLETEPFVATGYAYTFATIYHDLLIGTGNRILI